MSRPITDRLRALGIDPGEHMEQWEKERVAIGEATNYVSRLYADAALAELMSLCEDLYLKRLPCREAEVAQRRYEQAEAERDALQHIIDCADTPLMRDVMAARDQAKAKLTRSETAFGILSDSHPDESKEAWRKAGELCREGEA